jgi:hypothetical protein
MNDSQAHASTFEIQPTEFDIVKPLIKAAGCLLPAASTFAA